MRIRTRLVTAATIVVLAVSPATATAAPAITQPTAPSSSSTPVLPAELQSEVLRQNQILESTPQASDAQAQAFPPLIVAAGQAILAAARAIPGAYAALVNAVRAGYTSFNAWCTSTVWCAAAAGFLLEDVWDYLASIL